VLFCFFPSNTNTSWGSFENLTEKSGNGGKENRGAKGHASEWVKPGDSITLLDYPGKDMKCFQRSI
jgi:hypothetical protein